MSVMTRLQVHERWLAPVLGFFVGASWTANFILASDRHFRVSDELRRKGYEVNNKRMIGERARAFNREQQAQWEKQQERILRFAQSR
ncbi:hypothetical protein MVLG_01446 [Microbotryum lychnidis-dioicae p1A1 Lamole]|uniref:Uncharacterized protein n=1 Tax=Microbotryum lychnidis-dioicae (strain p1A1 Lamole / MvSl-1064) TaxID=683840 RepID=U5H256_USTV1|nr:hypothetical protein MVLG_01446 [Microbotryum lychnidis-dioicae p1A1 Lamole]|eukprot:KDE08411.1 hypothetical protein MVLG_01446 [Microbotryum lychnidis-dioicae p1A1 Lamole]